MQVPSSIRMARLPSGESPTHTILSRVANGNVSHLLLQQKHRRVKWINIFGVNEIWFIPLLRYQTQTKFNVKPPQLCLAVRVPWTPARWAVLCRARTHDPSSPAWSVILHEGQAPDWNAGTGTIDHNSGTQERLMMPLFLLYTRQKHTKNSYN